MQFAAQVTKARGSIGDANRAAVKRAGYGDAQIFEITLHVAQNACTNSLNKVARTVVDSPVAAARAA